VTKMLPKSHCNGFDKVPLVLRNLVISTFSNINNDLKSYVINSQITVNITCKLQVV
jgi:hypothetical protein